MWQRLKNLYNRYAARALTLEGRLGPVAGVDLSVLQVADGVLELSGVAESTPVVLRVGPARARSDVPPGRSFALSVTLPAGVSPRAARLTVGTEDIALPWIAPRRADAQVALSFALAGIRVLPDVVTWALGKDPAAKARVKRGLLLDAVVAGHDLPAGLIAAGQDGTEAQPFTIVLPVYDAHDVLVECLDRVVRHSLGAWSMVLVDDASPDPRIAPLLSGFAGQHPQVELVSLAENMGFVGAVNTGLDRATQGAHRGPVVLLNSDALVPAGWDLRLLAPMQQPDVASVTPMSNDAEIFGVPALCAPVGLAAEAVDTIDAAAARVAPDLSTAEAPTGVGFCMALSREWLAQVPRLDSAFGRGYGEEVDWCQKVRALGGRHLGTGRLFVEHRGGGSFGSEAKARLIARNGRIISDRYPEYDMEVQRFIAADPLAGPRLALACGWAATACGADPVPIYLAHWLGGGADMWLQKQGQDRAEAGLPTLILRVGGPCQWQLEVVGPGGATSCRTNDLSAIEALLAPIQTRQVIYSNGVGADDPAALPDVLLRIAQGGPIDVLFHDYYPLSESFILVDADGRYRGPRLGETGQEWTPPISESWRAAWDPVLQAARTLVVFSAESGRLIADLRADLAAKIAVRPHTTAPAAPLPPAKPGAAPVLASLGNLAPHKGAGVMSALSRGWSKRFPKAKLYVLGDMDPGYGLSRDGVLHGAYTPDALPDLVRRYGITHWVIPSVWPETFSFTTHEALATGLPVFAFGIGAQGAAVAAVPNGVVIPWDPEADPADLLRDALSQAGF